MLPESRPNLLIDTATLVSELQGYYADKKLSPSLRTYPGGISRTVLSRLGCTQMANLSPRHTNPSDEDMPDVGACLQMVLLEMANGIGDAPNAAMSVLGAIGKYGFWQSCAESENGAYALAIALIFYVGAYAEEGSLSLAVTSDVARILEGWLELEVNVGMPSISDVCQKMFGPGWCSLMLSEETLLGGSEYWATEELTCAKVARDRPPFLSGLCAAQSAILEIDLPEMEPHS